MHHLHQLLSLGVTAACATDLDRNVIPHTLEPATHHLKHLRRILLVPLAPLIERQEVDNQSSSHLGCVLDRLANAACLETNRPARSVRCLREQTPRPLALRVTTKDINRASDVVHLLGNHLHQGEEQVCQLRQGDRVDRRAARKLPDVIGDAELAACVAVKRLQLLFQFIQYTGWHGLLRRPIPQHIVMVDRPEPVLEVLQRSQTLRLTLTIRRLDNRDVLDASGGDVRKLCLALVQHDIGNHLGLLDAVTHRPVACVRGGRFT